MQRFLTLATMWGLICLTTGLGSALAKGNKDGGTAPMKKTTRRIEEKKAKPKAVTGVKAANQESTRQRGSTSGAREVPDTKTINEQLNQLRQNVTALQKLTGEQINWQVLSSGGGLGTSTNFQLVSVLGQTAAGTGASTNYTLHHGFLQDFSAGGCCVGSTGNVNGDPGDVTDIADLTALIDHLFISFTPLLCQEEANINGDAGGTVDIADLTALIDHLFISFAPTAPCQ